MIKKGCRSILFLSKEFKLSYFLAASTALTSAITSSLSLRLLVRASHLKCQLKEFLWNFPPQIAGTKKPTEVGF